MTTVVGTFTDPQNPSVPAEGQVWFSVAVTAVDSTPLPHFVTRTLVRADLDETGSFTVELVDSYDPGWLTEEPMPYRVRIAVSGHYGEYSALIPASDDPVDLTGLLLLDQPPEVVLVPGADSEVPGPPGPPGPTAISADANNLAELGTDGLLYVPPAAGGGVTDHGLLTGLADADHPIGAVQGLQAALDGKAALSHSHALGDLPSTVATDTEVSAAIAAHAAAADPHTGYQREAEKGAASGYASLDSTTRVPIGQVPTGLSGTTVALGNHSHTPAAIGAEPAGAVAAHEAAPDPHPQYSTEPGPEGPQGPQGDPGPAGPPGTAYLNAQWGFNQSTTVSPANGTMRMNATTYAATTLLWIAEEDRDGLNRAAGLDVAQVGDEIIMQSAQGRAVWLISDHADSGTYRTLTVTLVESSGTRPSAGSHTTLYFASVGGAGASALDDLTDVDAATPADGDALLWDETAGAWVPGAAGVDLLTAEGTFTAATTLTIGDCFTAEFFEYRLVLFHTAVDGAAGSYSGTQLRLVSEAGTETGAVYQEGSLYTGGDWVYTDDTKFTADPSYAGSKSRSMWRFVYPHQSETTFVQGSGFNRTPSSGGATYETGFVDTATAYTGLVFTFDLANSGHYKVWGVPRTGGGGGGASALDDLIGVDAATPADGDVLTWDAGASRWVAQSLVGLMAKVQQ